MGREKIGSRGEYSPNGSWKGIQRKGDWHLKMVALQDVWRPFICLGAAYLRLEEERPLSSWAR